MTPSCSLVAPRITRTSRARIRPFTRICDCRLNQSSWPATREVNRGAVFIFPHLPLGPWLASGHFCLTTPADAAVKARLFASRLEVVSNIRSLARLICQVTRGRAVPGARRAVAKPSHSEQEYLRWDQR